MVAADDAPPADQDEARHAGVDVNEPESFVLRVLACRVQVLGDVVPPRLDLMLGVAGFLQPFTARGQRADPGAFKLDERPPDPGRVGFRDQEVGDVAARQSASAAEATGRARRPGHR